MELETRAKELLELNEYINIATASQDAQPWNTPATGVYDSELSFYWSSWKNAQHSINVRANSKVFLTLYDSTRKRGENHQRCLYVKATATELLDPSEISLAINLLYEQSSNQKPSDFLGDAERRMYKAIPEQLWLNDLSEKEVTRETIKMRIEVSLDGVRALL